MARIGGDYTLRTMTAMAAQLDYDYALAVVYIAILQANLAPLMEDPALSARYAGVDTVAPEDLRRPISVHALSLDLGIPYETTRRHVKALIESGLCRRVENGVVILPHTIENVSLRLRRNFENVQAFVTDLRRGGVLEPTDEAPLS